MIKLIGYSLGIFICCSFFSCVSYKYEFRPTNKTVNLGLSKALAKNLKEDQLYLSFTKSYNQSRIKIYENNKILFDSLMPADKKYITKAFKVNKSSDIMIYFEDIRKPLKITKEQMKDYKFIYIEKKKRKVLIEFNNGTKNFYGKLYLD